jgi:hypothetical protein
VTACNSLERLQFLEGWGCGRDVPPPRKQLVEYDILVRFRHHDFLLLGQANDNAEHTNPSPHTVSHDATVIVSRVSSRLLAWTTMTGASSPSSSTMSTFSPSEITSLALANATGAQLKFWIENTNKSLPKKVLTKTGRVDELRKKLAKHYSIDLSAMPLQSDTTFEGPKMLDTTIIKKQWTWLRELGEEWLSAGTAFQLKPDDSK